MPLTSDLQTGSVWAAAAEGSGTGLNLKAGQAEGSANSVKE